MIRPFWDIGQCDISSASPMKVRFLPSILVAITALIAGVAVAEEPGKGKAKGKSKKPKSKKGKGKKKKKGKNKVTKRRNAVPTAE